MRYRKYTLDLLERPTPFPLMRGERVIFYYTASYDTGALFSVWRPGILYLTNKSLLFVQVKKVKFEVPLREIQGMEIVKRKWIFGKSVPQLNLFWPNNLKKGIYIAVRNPQYWKESIEALKKKKLSVDIFDEDHEMVIIMELLGVREENIEVYAQEKRVNILFKDSKGNEESEEILLPVEVCASKFSQKFQNQILTLRISK